MFKNFNDDKLVEQIDNGCLFFGWVKIFFMQRRKGFYAIRKSIPDRFKILVKVPHLYRSCKEKFLQHYFL